MALSIKIDNNQEINPNVFAESSVVPSGTNNLVNVLRTNNTQQMTGSTEGSPSQLTHPIPTTNHGVGASVISNSKKSKNANTYSYQFTSLFIPGPPALVKKNLAVLDQNGNIVYNDTQTGTASFANTIELSMFNIAKNNLGDL